MTSNYVIVQTKLWLDVGNDKHFPLYNSGGSIMRAVLKLQRGVQKPPQTVAGSSRNPGPLR